MYRLCTGLLTPVTSVVLAPRCARLAYLRLFRLPVPYTRLDTGVVTVEVFSLPSAKVPTHLNGIHSQPGTFTSIYGNAYLLL